MSKANGTRVLTCTCANPFQDSVYGTNKRVANKKGGKSVNSSYRCTICGKELDGK